MVVANRDINLGLVTATNAVGLSAGTVNQVGSILDGDLAIADNLDIQAANLIMRATGSIGTSETANGTPGLNSRAIDLQVGTVSSSAVQGTYLEELAAGGDLRIGSNDAINLSATVPAVQRVYFNSTSQNVNAGLTPQSIAALNGVTDNAVVKAVARNGGLTIDNTVNAGSDILLQARGASGNVLLNANVASTAGHVTVDASANVIQKANVSTAANGTVFIDADASVLMDKLATISTANQDVLVRAAQDFRLGIVNAGTADVALEAGGSILDAQRFLAADAAAGQNQVTLLNATGLQVGDTIILDDIDSATQTLTITGIAGNVLTLSGNLTDAYSVAQSAILEDTRDVTQVLANQLKMVATGGSIGQADPTAAATANNNSINTQVNTLAATSASGIYISETNGVTVANVDAVTVTQANFNSTTSAVAATGSEDLITTANGPIKLQTTAGNIGINSGANAAFGVSANGTGDVLLQTLANNGDVTISGDVVSGTGHVSVLAQDDIIQNSDVITSGTVYFQANNATVDGAVLMGSSWLALQTLPLQALARGMCYLVQQTKAISFLVRLQRRMRTSA